MSWQYSDAPSHIAPETGPNLLTGPGPWTVTLEPGQEYVLTVDVLGDGDTLVEWQVSVTDGETGDLDYPTISETVPGGDWVTVTLPLTAPAFDATATVTLSTPGQSRDPSLAALTGRTILTVPGDVLAETIMASGGIVAGTLGGARVELTDEGLAAFDTDGTETAQIRGVGGEFVGGEFRTSDALPGQVTLSDTGYTHSGTGVSRPGIRIDPEDATGLAAAPGIGPFGTGFAIDGGRNTSGERASIVMYPSHALLRADGGSTTGVSDVHAQPGRAELVARKGLMNGSARVTPGGAYLDATHSGGAAAGSAHADTLGARLRAYRPDGTRAGAMEVSEGSTISRSHSGNGSESGWVRARSQDAELAYVAPDNTYFSRIKADANEAFLYTRAGGAGRYLSVDADGIWVRSGSTAYNLEETAQDSGWQAITHATGYQNASGGAPFQYRRMGGMIHLRGRVSATSGVLTAGTAYTIGTLPAGARPAHTHRTIIAGGSASAWGRIDISGGTGALTVAPISANMDWVDLAGTMWTVD